jgi:hypothetical protein
LLTALSLARRHSAQMLYGLRNIKLLIFQSF